MKKIMKIGIALLVGMAIVMAVGCNNDPTGPTIGTNATLASATIDDEAATLPTAYADWEEAYENAQPIARDTKPSSIVIAAVPADSKATVEYAFSTGTAEPTNYVEDGEFTISAAQAEAGSVFTVMVTAEDGITTRYYVWKLALSSDATLTNLTFDGNAVTLGTGGTAVDVAAGSRGTLSLTWPANTSGKTIVATPTHAAARVTGYAIAAAGATSPTFVTVPATANNTFTTNAAITDGQHLVIRVRADDGTLYYYRIVVSVTDNRSNVATLTGLTVATVAATLGNGETAVNVAAGNRGSVTLTYAQAASGSSIAATPTHTAARVTGYAIAASTENNPTFVNVTPPANTFTTNARITNGYHLFIRVQAENESLHYYRLVVTISDPPNSDATLQSLTIGGEAVAQIGAGQGDVNVAGVNQGAVTIDDTKVGLGTTIVATPSNSAAKVTGYAIAAASNNSPDFIPVTANSFTTNAAITSGQHLFIRVQASDEDFLRYYRIAVTVVAVAADGRLSSLRISDVEAMLGAGQTAVNVADANRGYIKIDHTKVAADATIIATPVQPGARVTGYAAVASTNNSPEFTEVTTNTFTIAAAITGGQHLFIRVQATDGTSLYYYRIAVVVTGIPGEDTSIATFRMGSGSNWAIGTEGIGTLVPDGTALTDTHIQVTPASNRGAITLGPAHRAVGTVVEIIPTDDTTQVISIGIGCASGSVMPTVTNTTWLNVDQTTKAVTAAISETMGGITATGVVNVFFRVQSTNGNIHCYRVVVTLSD